MSTNSLITFIEGQKIKASETNANNNYLLDQITERVNALRIEIDRKLEDFQNTVSSGSLGVGDIKIAVYDTLPANFLVCNGASLLIEEYNDLYNKIGGLYGQVDDYHFNIPDFRDKVPEGFRDTEEPFGSYQPGKAPNIKGELGLGPSGAYFSTKSGAFYKLDGSATRNQYQMESGSKNAYFSANASSNVYSDDATRITVDRLKVNFLIKYKN